MVSLDEEKNLLESNKTWVEHATKSQHDLDNRTSEEKSPTISLVVFKIEREYYAVPISLIKEVIRTPSIAPMPQTPEHIAGVGNVRGNVIALIDSYIKIRKEKNKGSNQFTMVINSDQMQVGLLINEVPDTILIRENEIKRDARILKNLSVEDQFITGLLKYEDRMIFLLDIQAMI